MGSGISHTGEQPKLERTTEVCSRFQAGAGQKARTKVRAFVLLGDGIVVRDKHISADAAYWSVRFALRMGTVTVKAGDFAGVLARSGAEFVSVRTDAGTWAIAALGWGFRH